MYRLVTLQKQATSYWNKTVQKDQILVKHFDNWIIIYIKGYRFASTLMSSGFKKVYFRIDFNLDIPLSYNFKILS